LKEIMLILLMGTGTLFMLLSAIGIARMPDLFTRMHAATKVGTVGVSGIVLAAALHFEQMKVAAPALLIIVFMLATAPVAAHMIGRAAYEFGVELWKGTVVDEWKSQRPPKPPPANKP
jgi:multicomponent Na+:H+ antiporter subunit G